VWLEDRWMSDEKKNKPSFSADALPELWGAMRGTVTTPPDMELTTPTGEEWEADRDPLPIEVSMPAMDSVAKTGD
jgi:hypothetical protein